MTSDFETVVEALVNDLVFNVTGLTGIPPENIHKFWPANPEFLEASVGERHLAVWPAGEGEVAAPMGIGFHELHQVYVITVWENAGIEGPRRMADEGANKTWLQLHNDIRARFYVTANQTLAGLDLLWYSGAQFHDVPGDVRYMVIRLTGKHLAGFS